jgi:WD40 repeat protein
MSVKHSFPVVLVILLFAAGTVEGQRVDPRRRGPSSGSRPESPKAAAETGMSLRALVTQPTPVPRASNWTLESRRHRGAMYSLAASPDGRHVATGGIDGTIRIWDLESGELVRALVGHNYYVYGLSWAPNGNLLASAGSFDNTLRLWDLQKGDQSQLFKGFEAYVHHVAWSPDGSKVIAAGGSSGWIWLGEGKEGKKILEVGQDVSSLAWSPDGNYVAICARQMPVSILDLAQASATTTLGTVNDGFTSAAWASDGKRLATGGSAGTTIWEVAEGKEVHKLAGPCTSLAWSSDGKRLATAYPSLPIQLWDTTSGKPTAKLASQASKILWHAKSQQLLALSTTELVVWDPAQAKPIRTVEISGTNPPVWTSSNRPVVTGLGTAVLFLWDANTAKFLAKLEGHTGPVTTVAFSRDGKLLASASSDKTVRLWKTESGKLSKTLEGHTATVTTLSWSPDGKLLASAGADKTVRLWDDDGESQGVLEGHTAAVNALAWTPSSSLLASGGSDQMVLIWDPDKRQQARTLEAYQIVQSLAVSSVGRTLALACGTADDTVRVFNASNGQSLASLSLPGSPPNVAALSWQPGGSLLLSGRSNHTVQLWDVRANKAVQNLRAMAPVVYVTWAANGAVLVAGNNDRTVRFWDAANGQLRGVLLAEHDALVMISADGNWRADSDKRPDLLAIVQTPTGQLTLPPDQFASRFGWKNNPNRIKLAPR